MPTDAPSRSRSRCRTLLSVGLLATAVGCWDTSGVQFVESAPDQRECESTHCPCTLDDECPLDLRCVDGGCTQYDGPIEKSLVRSVEAEAGPASMGEQCMRGFQCDSGLCVSGIEGGLCTTECDDACPEGWQCDLIGPAEFQMRLCTLTCDEREETCNGRDDDCDGTLDEGFLIDGLYSTKAHCGACGTDCDARIPNALGTECAVADGVASCRATGCEEGYFAFADGSVCLPLPDNLCQGCQRDQDCLVPSSRCLELSNGLKVCGRECAPDSPYGAQCPDGYACNDLEQGSQCLPISGQCQCTPDSEGLVRPCEVLSCIGLQVCEGDAGGFEFGMCSAEGVLPEICDEQDNDCDGDIDEGFVDQIGTQWTRSALPARRLPDRTPGRRHL